MSKENLGILKYVVLIFLGWRVALLFLTFIGVSLLPNKFPDFLNEGNGTPSIEVRYLNHWANWDGGHFRGIAEAGYKSVQTVFFPLLPLLINILMHLGIPSLWGGLLITNLSTIIALFFLYKLILIDFDQTIAKRAIFALLIFPTSFYLGAVYSEPLFLFLTISAFYFSRTAKLGLNSNQSSKRWLLAFFLAGLAAVTRLIGIAVIIAILAEYLLKNPHPFSLKYLFSTKLRRFFLYFLIFTFFVKSLQTIFINLKLWPIVGAMDIYVPFLLPIAGAILALVVLEFILNNLIFNTVLSKALILILVSIIPFLGYLFFMHLEFNAPFSFLTNEENWHRKLSLPWEAPISYFNFLIAKNIFTIPWTAHSIIEFFSFSILLVGLLFSTYKLRYSYSIFYLLAFSLPLFSGTLIAIHRYALVIFPLFIIFGMIRNEYLQKIGTFIFLTLMSLLAVMYFNHYWVS